MGKKAVDFEGMRHLLAWKPIETAKRTLLATTRYVETVLCLQLCCHYKSIFPLLNANRLDEVYAAENFFSNTGYVITYAGYPVDGVHPKMPPSISFSGMY